MNSLSLSGRIMFGRDIFKHLICSSHRTARTRLIKIGIYTVKNRGYILACYGRLGCSAPLIEEQIMK